MLVGSFTQTIVLLVGCPLRRLCVCLGICLSLCVCVCLFVVGFICLLSYICYVFIMC